MSSSPYLFNLFQELPLFRFEENRLIEFIEFKLKIVLPYKYKMCASSYVNLHGRCSINSIWNFINNTNKKEVLLYKVKQVMLVGGEMDLHYLLGL